MSSQPHSSISSRTLSTFVSREVVHHHLPLRRVVARTRSTYVSKTAEVVAPSPVWEDPMSSVLMLEITVVLAHWPLALRRPRVQSRQRGVRSHLVDEDQPIGSDSLGDHHPSVALKNSWRSGAPTVRFGRSPAAS